MNLTERQLWMILLLFIAILFISIDLTRTYYKVSNQKIVYRYIPRTFNQEMDHDVPVSEIFEKMFTNPSPWIAGLNDGESRKVDKINKFFITQM
jgi:hypothetical protein